MLLDGIGLSREERLVHEEVARLEDPAVGGDEVARAEPHHVARHDLAHGQLVRRTVADHGGSHGDRGLEPLRGTPGAVLLHEIQRDAHHHHGGDDEEARHVAGQTRDRAGGKKEQDQGVTEARQELDHEQAARGASTLGP